MPIEQTAFGFLERFSVTFGLKAFFVLFLIFYFVFSLVIFRQIQLMGKTVYSPVVPFLKFIGIIQIGAALAILFMVLGSF